MQDIEKLTNEQLEAILKLTKDEVTDVYNRATTMRKIQETLQSDEKNGNYALVMVDVDDFKKINDTFGHPCGDSTIHYVAKTIKECFDKDVIIGRVGGDEFFVFTKNLGYDVIYANAKTLLEKAQMVIAKDGTKMTVSVSIGIATYNTQNGEKTFDELYAEADCALYKAKVLGKNAVIFADDIEKDVIKLDNKSEKMISLNIQEILNKIEIGIAIFRAETPDEFIPVFCNEGYFKLLGLSFSEFTQQVVKENDYCVHPDDIAKVRKRIAKAFRGNRKIYYTLRFKTCKDGYKWMTLNGNIVEQADGTYEIYIVFLDAEEAIREKQIREERYKSLIGQAFKQSQDALSILHFNLTKNVSRSLYRAVSVNNGVILNETVDAFIETASKNVSYDNKREEFLQTFSRSALLLSFEQGILSIEKAIPITLSNDRIIWCKQIANLSRNPRTGEIECVAMLVEDDKELRFKGYMKRIAYADYDFIGCINVKTKYLTTMKDSDRRVKYEQVGEEVDYVLRIKSVIEELVQEDFVEECAIALNFDKIIDELKDKDLYVCTFPAKREVLGHDGAFQWRLGYADQNKKELIITRKETFSFLDKRQIIDIPHDDNWLRSQEINSAVIKGALRRNKILIADDETANRKVLKTVFEKEFEIIEATDGEQAIQLIDENYDKLALILLDMTMPKKTGLDVLIHNKMRGYGERIPVIIVTDSTTDEMNLRSLKYGVSDIVNKSYNGEIIKRRALNLIELYAHKEDVELQLAKWKRDAIKMREVADKNNELLIEILSSVVEFRSFESGTHIKRVRVLTEIMLKTWLSLYPDTTFTEYDIDQIARASTMHDIGKVAIPDSILQKPGKLTQEEFEIMKKHTALGCEMLKQIKQEDNKLYQYCYDICRYHHERDDGRGYPDGLKGNEIPVWAKIVSIVDVFDALTSPRVYKAAYSQEKALEMIKNGECGKFADDLLKCFELSYNLMIATKKD